MLHSIPIDSVPILAHQAIAIDKSTYQEQQGALRHVEVGNDGINQPELEAWCNQDLCGGNQIGLSRGIQKVEDDLKSLYGSEGVLVFVWFPLMNDEFLGMSLGILVQLLSYVI